MGFTNRGLLGNPLGIASVLIAQQLRRLNDSAGGPDSQSLGSMQPCVKPS
jgi:hypothetical protein